MQQTVETATARQEAVSKLETAARNGYSEEQGIQVSAMYRVAKDLGLGEDYVKRSLDLLYPTPEQKIADLRNVNSEPSFEGLDKICMGKLRRYSTEIENVIHQKLPHINLSSSIERIVLGGYEGTGYNYAWDINIIEENTVDKRLWFAPWKKVKKRVSALKPFMCIKIQMFNRRGEYAYAELHCLDPLFTRICSDQIQEFPKLVEELKVRNNVTPKVFHDYDPEE